MRCACSWPMLPELRARCPPISRSKSLPRPMRLLIPRVALAFFLAHMHSTLAHMQMQQSACRHPGTISCHGGTDWDAGLLAITP